MARLTRDQWLEDKDRRDSDRSLYSFAKYVLGYDLYEQPHKEICDFIQRPEKFKLILLPRGSFKTSIISQAYPIWKLMKNPNYRILLDSEVAGNSVRNLEVIKKIYEGCKRFRFVFGDQVNLSNWTKDEITLKSRSNFLIKEPSFGTAGVDTVQIGPHWNIIIVDDPHSEKNTDTKEQINKVYDHFRLLYSLADHFDFEMIVIGTRWNADDLYGKILEGHKDFISLVRSAVDDGGNLYFPALLSHEKLEMLRKNQGSRIFNAQYMNDPFPSDEEANFKTQWFRYETKIPEEVRLTLFIDPSIGATEDHDYFACVVAGLDSKNNLHVADYLYGHWKPYEGIAKAFLLINKHPKIREVAIETIAFQKVLKFHIEAEMRRTNKFLQVTEIKHHAKSKIDRIIGLSPRYEQGAVYHQEWMKNGELEDELLKFPRGRRRDLADALSFSSAVLRPRIERKPGMLVAPINSTDDLIHRHLQNRMKSAKIGTVHPYLGTQW